MCIIAVTDLNPAMTL